MNNPYKILGVTNKATKEEIQRAFKQLAKKLHPDRNHDPKACDLFRTVNEAYQQLQQNDFKPDSYQSASSTKPGFYSPHENVNYYEQAYRESRSSGHNETYEQFMNRQREQQEYFRQQFSEAHQKAYDEYQKKERRQRRFQRAIWEFYLLSVTLWVFYVVTRRERSSFMEEFSQRLNPAQTLERQFSKPAFLERETQESKQFESKMKKRIERQNSDQNPDQDNRQQ